MQDASHVTAGLVDGAVVVVLEYANPAGCQPAVPDLQEPGVQGLHSPVCWGNAYEMACKEANATAERAKCMPVARSRGRRGKKCLMLAKECM